MKRHRRRSHTLNRCWILPTTSWWSTAGQEHPASNFYTQFVCVSDLTVGGLHVWITPKPSTPSGMTERGTDQHTLVASSLSGLTRFTAVRWRQTKSLVASRTCRSTYGASGTALTCPIATSSV